MEVDVIHNENCLETLKRLPDESIQCCVTSPPYWGLRDYGLPPIEWQSISYHPMPGLPDLEVPAWEGCLGLEPTPEMFAAHIVLIFRDLRRVLRKDGTLWLNFGDSYATGAGRVGNCPGGGDQGKRWRDPTLKGYRGNHADDPKRSAHSSSMIGPIIQPNRMPIKGLKPKDLVGIPWRIAFALQADGWYLRQDIIWAKPNPMPESVTDRCTKNHEYLFLLTKSSKYYYDNEAIKEPATFGSKGSRFDDGKNMISHPNVGKVRPSAPKGSFHGKTEAMAETGQNAFRAVTITRNLRSVWTVATKPFNGAHFAVMPEKLVEPCILAGSKPGDIVFDPFGGAMTTAVVARKFDRRFIMSELNPEYCEMGKARLKTHIQRSLSMPMEHEKCQSSAA